MQSEGSENILVALRIRPANADEAEIK